MVSVRSCNVSGQLLKSSQAGRGVRTEFSAQKGNICMLLLLRLQGLFSEPKKSSKQFIKMRLSSFVQGVRAEPMIPP